MGARISINFKNKDYKSPVLFSHWGGPEFLEDAKKYLEELKEKTKKYKRITPLSRMEPQTVMVDFIRHLTKDMEMVSGDLYLGSDEHDGDNGDYGHHEIDLE